MEILQIESAEDVVLIADEHYFHTNIIEYEKRPFADVEEMNKALIKNHNMLVRKYHTVYHLGDFSLSNLANSAKILEQLNGTHILVMGNHDRQRTRSWWKKVGFTEVYRTPVRFMYDDITVVLSHEPLDVYNCINIHGHSHSKAGSFPFYDADVHRCISVEKTGYHPMPLSIIISYF